MKRALFLLSVLLLCLVSLQAKAGVGYLERYGKESRFAFDFYAANKQLFERAAEKSGFSSAFLFAVVAPELSQYNRISDRGQTYMLKTLYVQGGKGYANFSIGYFSMKPSFAEHIESQVKNNKILSGSYPELALALPAMGARAERVKRLESTEWQLKYLQVLCLLCKSKFAEMLFETQADELMFCAAVYNIGFRPANELAEIRKRKMFPRFGPEKFRYEDVAAEFYKKHTNQ